MKRCALQVHCVLAMLLLFGCGDAHVTDTETPETRAHLSVLFIGNSLTFYNDLPSLLQQVTQQAGKGRSVEVQMVAEGGYTLQQHWLNHTALDEIRSGTFDVVVLQEQSSTPLTGPTRFEQYATLFDTEIRKTGASTLLFVTWAQQPEPEKQQAITDAYLAVAKKLNARVAPVGPAWQSALSAHPELQLYDADGAHPALLGSYLAAAVFYATLFRETPESTSTTSEQQMLQRIAWQTYREFY